MRNYERNAASSGTQARNAEVPLVLVLAWIAALAATTLGLTAFHAFGG